MADEPSSESKNQKEPPAPEVLKPQSDKKADDPAEEQPKAGATAGTSKASLLRPRHGTYRPSHKATFIGLGVVVLILVINAGVIAFVIKGQSKSKSEAEQGQVTISQGVLDQLGVNRSAVGTAGVELTVNPDARFNGKLQVGGDVSIAGRLQLNNTFSASSANFAQLQAGNTALAQLNVNGNTSLSNVAVRNELAVTGITRLQGPVTVSQLLTVNNLNVSNNLAVGGVLSSNGFHTSNLVTDSTLTIGGHIITRGAAPGISPGNALGSNGTVSISGSDAAGTVAANIGVGAGSGIVANVTFRRAYDSTPRVVITPVGGGINGSVYVNRSARGFSIGINGSMPPGGFAFDYIVMQ